MKPTKQEVPCLVAVDNIIFEKYQNQWKELHRLSEGYVHNRKRITHVVQKTKESYRNLPIIDIEITTCGIDVIVGE